MNRPSILALKALIAAMILLLVIAQVIAIPQTAAVYALRYAEFAGLEVPGTIIAIAFIVCVQAVLVCVWRMLSLVSDDRIFSDRAFVYVNVILWSITVADALLIVALIALSAAGAASPSITLLCAFGIVVGAGLALLVLVMRGLLRKALQLEQDLAEVV